MPKLCQMPRHKIKYIISALPDICITRIREKLEKHLLSPQPPISAGWLGGLWEGSVNQEDETDKWMHLVLASGTAP